MMNEANSDITMYILGVVFWLVLVGIVVALRKK